MNKTSLAFKDNPANPLGLLPIVYMPSFHFKEFYATLEGRPASCQCHSSDHELRTKALSKQAYSSQSQLACSHSLAAFDLSPPPRFVPSIVFTAAKPLRRCPFNSHFTQCGARPMREREYGVHTK